VEYYLPEGRWTHFFTGRSVKGGRWLSERYDFFSLPLLVRPNTALVISDREDRPDYDYSIGFTLRLYQLEDGATARTVIPTLQGEVAVVFNVQRLGSVITISWEGEPHQWRILLVGVQSFASVIGGIMQVADEGAFIMPEDDATTVQVILA
jgi:alpha-D-xyloside xylohydrolase